MLSVFTILAASLGWVFNMAILPKFNSGDDIEKALNAGFLNEVVSRLNRASGTRTFRETVDNNSTIEVLAVNNTSGIFNAFQICTPNGLGLTPADESDRLQMQRRPLISIEEPLLATDFPCIALEPIAANGGIGKVAMGGVALCQVDFSSASHEYANPTPSVRAQMTSSATQGYVRVLWKESGTGIKWALVTWEQPDASKVYNAYFQRPHIYTTQLAQITGTPPPNGVTLLPIAFRSSQNGDICVITLDANTAINGKFHFELFAGVTNVNTNPFTGTQTWSTKSLALAYISERTTENRPIYTPGTQIYPNTYNGSFQIGYTNSLGWFGSNGLIYTSESQFSHSPFTITMPFTIKNTTSSSKDYLVKVGSFYAGTVNIATNNTTWPADIPALQYDNGLNSASMSYTKESA